MNYQRLYDQIIDRAKNRVLDGYREKHHIVPRSYGGSNSKANLVELTAREHFIAHWILFKIYKCPSMSKAYRLMLDDQNRRRGKDYEAAKKIYAASMMGDANVSKRPDVKIKLKQNCYSSFAGKKRPEHSVLMKSKGLMAGEKNPFYGKGHLQAGAKNHMARKVQGTHEKYGVMFWDTAKAASDHIGVSIQAVVQAIKKSHRSKLWTLEYVS